MKKLTFFQAQKVSHTFCAIKKLLIPLSLISITGCNTTGLIVREGEKIIYPFTWPNIIILFVITLIILWLIRHFIKNAK